MPRTIWDPRTGEGLLISTRIHLTKWLLLFNMGYPNAITATPLLPVVYLG